MAVELSIFSVCIAADSLSYSGRLVNANGSPVVGPVDLKFELAYSGNTSVILCTQDLAGVSLTNGVFHAKLELVCGSSLNEVLASVPTGQETVIRVTNTSATPDKVYSFQALHPVPTAQVAHGLSKLNANNNEVLTWTGSKWEPKPVSAGGSGTVTSVSSGTGLLGGTITNSGTFSVDIGTSAGKIPQLDGSGKLATSVETDPTVQSFAKSSLPTCGVNQVLKSNGTSFSCVADVDTDTTLVADGTTLSTSGLTISVKAEGLFDTHLSGISSSCGINQLLVTNGLGSFSCANKQWGESLGNLFFSTGAVTIGGTTPATSAILDLQSTTKGFLPPRMTTAQRNGLAATVGLMVYDTTENALFIFDGTQWIFASDSKGGYFRAHRLTSQSAVNGGTSTTILPNVESVDTENAFDPATGMYTVPRSGFYHFSAIVYWDSISTYGGLTIKANTGAIIGSAFHQLSTGSQLYLNASGSSYLNAGDKVYAYVWQWNSGAANVTYSSLAGFRVGSGGASGGGGGGALTADSVSSGHVVDNSLTVDDLNFASSEGIQFPQLGANPGSGVAGQLYYNSSTNALMFYNGSSWQALGAAGAVSSNSVDSSKIIDGSVSYADLNLSDGDVPLSKLAGASDSSLYLRGDKTWASFLTQVLATTFSVTPSNSAISNGDSLQTVVNKTQGQINNLVTSTGNHLIKNGTDTISGTVTVSAASGFLKIPLTPSGLDLTDAANVQYVNNYVESYGQWTKSGSDIYRSSGNVGIGTTTPASPLEVSGIIHSSSGGIKFPDGSIQTTASGVSGQAQFDSGWTTVASGAIYTFNHGLGVAPQLIRVQAKDNTTGKIIEVSPQYAYGYSTYGGLNGVTSDSSTIKVNTLNINRLGSYLTDANANANMEFASSQIRILAWASGVTPSIWSQSGLNTYFNSGNVGIGTSSPTQRLTVAGSANLIGGNLGISMESTADSTAQVTLKNDAQTFSMAVSGTAGDIFGIYDNTAATYRLAIAPTTGYIGIGGTMAPTSTLAIGSRILFDKGLGNVANGSDIWFSAQGVVAADTHLYLNAAANGSTTGDIFFGTGTETSAATNRMIIKNGGNVGIGTTTPAYALDVNGGVRSSSGFVTPSGFIAGTTTYGTDRVSFSTGTFYVLNESSVGVRLVNGATSWATQSDRRLKHDIHPIENALSKTLQITGMTYNYNVDPVETSRRVGVIAQDVQAVLPEAVEKDQDGYLSVKYSEIVPLVINAIKELYQKVLGQDKKLSQQTRQLASLETSKADKADTAMLKSELRAKDQKIKELEERLSRLEKAMEGKSNR